MRHLIIYRLTLLGVCLLSLFSCSKLIEVDIPKNQLTTDMVFSDSLSAISALNNLYFTLANNLNSNYNKYISQYVDEYSNTTTNDEFYNGRISVDNSTNSNLWGYFYEIIYSCNDIIERVPNSEKLNIRTKKELINEAKFIRAFCYYQLFTLYENIPLVLQTDVDENRMIVQSDRSKVFVQIIADLDDAKKELYEAYPSGDRARANKWSVCALLAQVYLYQNRWQESFNESDAVLRSGLYTPIEDVDKVFKSHSSETILQLWRLNGFIGDATTIIPSSRTALPRYIMTDVLRSAFEMNDLRQSIWLGENKVTTGGVTRSYWFPFKYKNRSVSNSSPEYLVLLRASEQYLIRAESKANLGDLKGAIDDLNIIRKRAGLSELSAPLSKEDCLKAIYHERRIELFGEWGKRFIDLKRTGRLDATMGDYKDTWVNGLSERLPIPYSELLYNTKLKQNEGYN
ncbi:RagB/SusD family nutrient uptake outer membrane protein [Sphingobacterium mizutaii]|uniref:RagB/SusD family nutrient uptake outer membrane protein n=1 Tax=Sphingobacterium mizutaii TaxID=1010 RepID=UPI0021D2BA50|nr:RagB/SusD family nutrient uptake outer membrane protein [Sphingobacterium mizutaii]